MAEVDYQDRGLFGSSKQSEEEDKDKGEGFFGRLNGFIHDTIGSGKPTAKVSGFHLPNITLERADVVVDVLVSNPNPIPIPLVYINYLIESEGRKLVSGSIPDAGTIHAHGSETIKIPVTLIYQDIKDTYDGIHAGEVIPYKVKIELIADVPVFGRFTLPLEKTGEIPIPYKPDVDVERVEFEYLSLEETSAALHLKVENKNKFDLGITVLDYTFTLADATIANATLSKSVNVEQCGVVTLEIPISFRPKDLGSVVWDIIRGRGAGYSMVGKLEVDTPFGPMHLPFSKKCGETALKKKAGARGLDDAEDEGEDYLHIPKSKRKSHHYASWVPGELQASRSYHTGTAVGSKLVFFGGIRDNDALNDVHIYDLGSGEWILPEILGTPPAPRYGHSAVLLNGERILVFGGNSSIPQDMIWFLEVDTPFVKLQSQLLGRDVVAWSKGILGNMPQPVVICGPSGVGKGTLIARLMKDFPSTFGFSVSHTTRQPRHKEKNGVHYHFIERRVMELAIQEGKFLESADVHGNLYGTSIAAVEAVADAGKRCILDIDVQGAQAVKKSGLDALFIFIAPPSLEQLESRLRGRGTEMEEQVQKRLNNAKAELEHGRNSSLFNHYLVNDDLEECYSEIKKLLELEFVESNATQNGFDEKVNLQPRYGHSASVVGQNVYIFGGDSDRNFKNTVTMLDISNLAGGAPEQTTGLRFSTLESKCQTSNGLMPSLSFVSSKLMELNSKENGHLVFEDKV